MKKGFIENIEENTVVVFFEDNTKEIFSLKDFPKNIKLDMIVYIQNKQIVKVEEHDKDLEKEIKELTKRTFKRFKKD